MYTLSYSTYVSDESVFGTLSKDKVKEVYKRPAEGMTLSTDILTRMYGKMINKLGMK